MTFGGLTKQLAGDDHGFLVGQQQAFALLYRVQRGFQARCTNDRSHDDIRFVHSGHGQQGFRASQDFRLAASRVKRFP
jgi:hypothetical protein